MALYRRTDSPNWWYSFKLPGKRQVKASTGTSDRKLASQIFTAEKNKAQRIGYQFEREKVRLKDLMTRYLEIYSKHTKVTYDIDILFVKKMGKFFGDIMVHEVTPAHVEEYRVFRLNENVSKSTINRECALLKSIFNRGIEWKKCTENPVTKIRFYSEKEFRRTKFLDQTEKARLLNACPLPAKRLVMVALLTGMRQGELLDLMWSDIDYSTGLIKVKHSKSGEPRYVPMNSELISLLKSISSISEYVFGTPEGKAEFTLYRKPFERAVKDAGIKDCVFHTLRHTFASDLVQKGVDLKTVAELLGHSTTLMTERYSHLSKDHKRMAVELLPKGINYTVGITQAVSSNGVI